MSSSSWIDLYSTGKPIRLCLADTTDDIGAVVKCKEAAHEIDKPLWVYKSGPLYLAYERYPENQKPIAHVYPAGRVEWRAKE